MVLRTLNSEGEWPHQWRCCRRSQACPGDSGTYRTYQQWGGGTACDLHSCNHVQLLLPDNHPSRSVVDLRHEAAHHELPSLQMLRIGNQQALEWLKFSYWCVAQYLY
jgi:hypothetical protein